MSFFDGQDPSTAGTPITPTQPARSAGPLSGRPRRQRPRGRRPDVERTDPLDSQEPAYPPSPYRAPAVASRLRSTGFGSDRPVIDAGRLTEEDYPRFALCTDPRRLGRDLEAVDRARYPYLLDILWPAADVDILFDLAEGARSGSLQLLAPFHSSRGGFRMLDLVMLVADFYSSPLSAERGARLRETVERTYDEEGREIGTRQSFDQFFDRFFTYYVRGDAIDGAYRRLEQGSLRPCDLLPGWEFAGFAVRGRRAGARGSHLVPVLHHRGLL